MPRRIGILWISLAWLTPVLVAPAFAAAIAVDATGCLHFVTSGPSGTCDAQSHNLKVELVNSCKTPVRVQICLRGANHLWVDCAAKDKLAPQEHFVGSSCNADGDYTYWGCSQVSGPGRCGGDDLVGKATNTPK